MPTEIEQTEDIIIEAVKDAVPAFAHVDSWPDGKDLKKLIEETLTMPACYVILASWNPGEKRVMGGSSSEQTMSFRLTVVSENQQSDKAGSREAYQYLDAIMTKLKDFKVTPLRGYLWPSAPVELLLVENGRYAYGLEFERRYNS